MPQLFFIISAFLTWKSLHKKESYTKADYIAFEKSRFIRLAPVYYFALAIALLLGQTWNSEVPFWDVLLHILFLNGLHVDAIHSILGVEWYISDLCIFFMIAPLLYKKIHNLKSSLIALMVSCFVAMVFSVAMNILFADRIASDTNFEMYVRTHFILNQLPIMLLGVVLFYLQQADIIIMKRKVCLISLGAILSFVALYGTMRFAGVRLISTSFVISLSFFYILLLVSYYLPTLGLKPLQVLGKYSLSIYLLHNLIVMNIAGFSETKLSMFGWFGLYLMIVLISLLIAIVVEETTNKIVNKMTNKA